MLSVIRVPKTLITTTDGPVDGRHVAVEPELDEEQDDEQPGGDVGRVRQTEAEVCR